MMTFYLYMMNTLNERRESGQGTIEYLGIAVLIGLLVVAVATWFSSDGAEAITEGLGNVITEITGAG